MEASFVNIAIVVVYLVAMLAFGWWGNSRTKSNSDLLVAGRRLRPFLYTGTMAAVVLGGASTVGVEADVPLVRGAPPKAGKVELPPEGRLTPDRKGVLNRDHPAPGKMPRPG